MFWYGMFIGMMLGFGGALLFSFFLGVGRVVGMQQGKE